MRLLSVLTCLTAAMLSGGCSSIFPAIQTDGPMLLTAMPGPTSVDVETIGGNVDIRVVQDLAQPQVTIYREALHGKGRREEAEAALQNIQYDVQMSNNETGQVLTVRTTVDDPEPHLLLANILIEAPAVDDVRVRTKSGRVFAYEIQGSVDIETTDGDVRVLTPWPMTEAVTINNHVGDIVYRVRGESTGMIDAETIDGNVNRRIEYGHVMNRPTSDADSFHATLNKGTNPIMLRTVRGDILIAVVPDPVGVGTFIWE